MKRRKKAVYIDYDYEAAYQKMLTDLEEDNMCRMLNEGRVRSIYATIWNIWRLGTTSWELKRKADFTPQNSSERCWTAFAWFMATSSLLTS